MQQSKESIRANFRAARLKLPPDYRSKAAIAAAKQFISQPLFQQSEHIACYVATHAELDTSPFIRKIWQAGKKCYLPRLTAEKTLQFALYQENDAMHANEYGILEPLPPAKCMSADELDVVVVPLVAYDLSGNRLGTGGGYYDRTFAFKQINASQKPYLIGFAYQIQEAPLLPAKDWDVKLDAVVTEKNFIQI